MLSSDQINMANMTYVIMENFGYVISSSFGASSEVSHSIGILCSRFVGFSMFLSYIGAFFAIIYAPLKQLIEGTPEGLWPKKFSQLKNSMPTYAMWAQAVLIIALIALVSFGGDNASAFFDKLVIMSNVAMTIPYMFLSAAFPFFKSKKGIDRPFEIFKSKYSAVIWSVIVTSVIGFANIFSIIEPGLQKGDWSSTCLSIAGPIIFSVMALSIYGFYEKRTKRK